MSVHAIKKLIQVFGVLHQMFALVLLIFAGYVLLSGSEIGRWFILLWLIPASIYFFWLGYRACNSPSPRVVRQICVTVFLVVALPFVALVQYAGWSEDSIGVMLPSAVLVLSALWLSTFGGRYFCRRLFKPDG